MKDFLFLGLFGLGSLQLRGNKGSAQHKRLTSRTVCRVNPKSNQLPISTIPAAETTWSIRLYVLKAWSKRAKTDW